MKFLTFVYVGRKAPDEDLPGVALHPLPVLAASGRVQGRVDMAVVEETVLEGEKTGASWQGEEEGNQRAAQTSDNAPEVTLMLAPETAPNTVRLQLGGLLARTLISGSAYGFTPLQLSSGPFYFYGAFYSKSCL